jgi:protein-disulfide isomerase
VKNSRLILIIGLLLFTVVVTACGAAGTIESPAAGSSPAQTDAEADPPAAAADNTAETTSPSIATNVEQAIIGPDGIEVGFTAEGRPYKGNPNAAVVIEEFSDYQCPFCGRFTAETLPSLLNNQVASGQAVIIYYDYPIPNLHPWATAAANAARCAGEQGALAYWGMHDQLFANINQWATDQALQFFSQYAEGLQLDMAAFDSCLESNKYVEAIDADVALGESLGVSSTPSFFLNNQPLVGAQPLAVFNQAIATVAEGGSIAEASGETAPQEPAVAPTPSTIIMDDVAATQGDADAPVTIIEFTDYQCPYCQRHATDTLPRLLAEMVESGRVHYVVKDFPLENIHPQAREAAIAARCAGEQDAYWPMHDALFAQQQAWTEAAPQHNEYFTTMAGELSLDTAAFTACLASGQHDALVQANLEEGAALGVRGTPTFFIDGYPVTGSQPFELFEYAVGLAEEDRLAEAYVQTGQEQQQQQQQQAAQPSQEVVDVPMTDAYSIGDANAPVTIVEFTDYQCPYCGRHYEQTYPQLLSNYVEAGLVRYVFKDFPLTSIHPQALEAAEAARCAGEQDAYLGMHDMLFDRQSQWGVADAATLFVGYAGELGLDADAFATCLSDGRYEGVIRADLDDGIRLGITGTPGFFINGRFLSGAQPYAVFQQAIDEMLTE